MSSENNLDIEKTLTCILQNIKEIDIRIPQQESAIIVVGETREGKTTLLNYLTGISLFSKKRNGFGGFEIYVVNSLNNADINNGSTSQTSLPYNKGKYWDCPSFGNTRGPVQEIINTYSVYTLIKSAKKLKVLVVVSEATISEMSKKKLLNLIQKLGETFKNNINLVEGLCLVVTQCKDPKLGNMRNGLLKILKEREGKEGFNSSQRNILNFLFSDRSQIAFSDAPQEEGPISDENKSEILNCLEKITYIQNLEPSISIGTDAKSFIKNLIEKLYNDIDEFISQKFDSALLNYVKDLIDHHDDTVEKLREHLNRLIEELKKISDVEDLQTFENNLDQILSIVKLFKKMILKVNFQKNIGYLKSEPTLKSNINKQELTFKGMIIGTKDIVKKLTGKIFEINVYGLNSIFIDEDEKAPGVILTLISPQLRVVGEKREISLKDNLDVNDEKQASDGINKDANCKLNKNINEVEASNSIFKEKSDIEIVGEIEQETIDKFRKFKEENVETIKEKTSDEIKTEKNK
ncbi:50S ribosome-binding GTPase family protein [Gigaspora margarita]|uniref:50S ribosome-binding GTPase family protein n=1 Tax=Gigaspora margarita TaxID=4874 RepID=A0A8H3X6Y1_GIGMA|nr:50S ribosome-binding GTPase family protein [Gigaspora margarita]